MGLKDPRVDAYIAKSQDFSRPILEHFRGLVHRGCPEVTETLKWSAPTFDYKGIICGMAAFKRYCSIGFWKDALLRDAKAFGGKGGTEAAKHLEHLGKVATLKEMPSDQAIMELIKEAVRLNDEGVKVPKRPTRAKAPVRVPTEFIKALKRAKSALANFKSMSPSHQREYVEWITEAKTVETRQRRLATAVEWIAAGKNRNWKYEKRSG